MHFTIMKFIGRDEEMSVLENQFEKVEHPFVIIKGRRRVGKCRLIHEFCRNKDAFHFQFDKEDNSAILQSFYNISVSSLKGELVPDGHTTLLARNDP